MRLAWFFQKLTLVLAMSIGTLHVFAAPSSPTPGSALKPREPVITPSQLPTELDQLESLDPGLRGDPQMMEGITPRSSGISATRLVRTQSRVVGLGVISGAIDSTQARTIPWVSLTFQNDNQNETGQSFGLSVADRDVWGLHWDTHQFCCLGENSEPYWGLGLGGFYDSREQLAAFVNIESYHVRARIGVEDLFSLGRQLRTEFILRAGLLGVSGQIGVGWTWAADDFYF